MAIDSLTLVRKRIGDDKKTETETFTVDDSTTTIQLRYGNVGIFNIYDISKQATPLTVSVDYSLDVTSGIITLLYVPSEGNISVVYYYYAFTDDELNELISSYGVNGASIEAIRWLLADASRLHDYTRGATSESVSQITSNLREMLNDYTKLGGLSAGNDGSASGGVSVKKRIHEYYRGKSDVIFDLSRDDSLSS